MSWLRELNVAPHVRQVVRQRSPSLLLLVGGWSCRFGWGLPLDWFVLGLQSGCVVWCGERIVISIDKLDAMKVYGVVDVHGFVEGESLIETSKSVMGCCCTIKSTSCHINPESH